MLVGKPKGKGLLDLRGHRREDNIETYFKGTGCKDYGPDSSGSSGGIF
jgi:hypothetical protein